MVFSFLVICEEKTHAFMFLSDALDMVDSYMVGGKTPTMLDFTIGKSYFYPNVDNEEPIVSEIKVVTDDLEEDEDA